MGTRTVTTVFAVQGEADYKRAVQNINREIKTLDAALKLNAEKWEDQADSLGGLAEKAGLLNELYQKQSEKVGEIENAWKNCKDTAQKYEDQIGQIKKKIELTKEEMDKLSGEGQGDSDAFAKLKENLEKLETELDNKSGMYDAAIRGAQNWETALYNAQTELLNLGGKLEEANRDVIDHFVAPMEEAEEAVEDVTEEAGIMEEEVPGSIEVVAQAVATAGLAEAFGKIRDAMQECIDKSIKFESDVAGVFKTVDLTAAEEEVMANAIKDLSTQIPATTTEIAAVAEAAGQLGIAKDDILAFTEVMIKMGATTNLPAEEAAESLAKFANITGLEGDEFERMASTVVELGNNGASTEKQIVEMATRMAATGDIVGMTAQDMLAFAAALSDVGIEAEAGGSSISKMFRILQNAVEGKKLGDLGYDEVTGMSPEEFTRLWGEDPARALLAFINGLQRMEEEGRSAVAVLGEMGISEIRLSNGMLALTAAGTLLEDHLNRSYRAWEENSALSEEAARRFETTESKVTMLGNAFSNFEAEIGEDYMKTLDPIIDGLGRFLKTATDLAEDSPALSTGIAAIGGGLGTITAVAGAGTIISGIVKALGMFGPKGAAIALGAGAVGALATAVVNLVNNSEDVSASVQSVLDANDAILEKTKNSESIYNGNMAAAQANKDEVNALIEKLWAFYEEAEKTPAVEGVIKETVDRLNELLPGLGATYDDLTGKISLTRAEMQLFAEEAANQKMLDALNQYLDELQGNKAVLELQSLSTQYETDVAKRRYEDAVKAYNEWEDSLGVVGYALRNLNPEWDKMSDAVWDAKSEYDALVESGNELSEKLKDVEDEIGFTTQAYEDMVSEMEEATRQTEAMIEAADILETKMQTMQHHGLANFDAAIAEEQQFYRNTVSAATLGVSNGAGFMITESGGGTVNNYNITVDAKNVKELNDIVRIAENEKRSIRMGYIKE